MHKLYFVRVQPIHACACKMKHGIPAHVTRVFSPVCGSELTTHEVTHLQKIACAFCGQHTRGTRVSHLAGVYRINKFSQYIVELLYLYSCLQHQNIIKM